MTRQRRPAAAAAAVTAAAAAATVVWAGRALVGGGGCWGAAGGGRGVASAAVRPRVPADSLSRLTLGRGLRARKGGEGEAEPPSDASLFDKAVWNAAEAVGGLRAAIVGESEEAFTSGPGQPARSREELLARLRADYDRNYFLTGDVDVELYAEDCEFADPFASFRGRERFVRNLRNLAGGFITAFRVTLLDFGGEAATEGAAAEGKGSALAVTSRLRVVLELALPWRPTLGWVWGVTHECEAQSDEVVGEEAWRCVVHREAWEIDPAEGVAMVFRPGKGLPN